MHWTHPSHPGRRVRLGYCLNLHAAEDIEGTLAGMRAVTLPLSERLARGELFGVGLYLPAVVARELVEHQPALEGFAHFLAEHRLDPYTYNAFPFGGFQSDGLKAEVFRPTWMDKERLAFTLDVARVAQAVTDIVGGCDDPAHISISTHTGMFASWVSCPDDLFACAEKLADCVDELAQIEERGGPCIILGLEPEPRANAGDTRELAAWLAQAREHGARYLSDGIGLPLAFAEELMKRHLGTCLDCCHSAVEFEAAETALELAAANDGRIAKLQFSSALSVPRPAHNPSGVRRLLDMDEPRYLHQVTGAHATERLQVCDLPELAGALEGPQRAAWEACDEWRCHFHVPVDLDRLGGQEGAGEPGLVTTRPHADAILEAALRDPSRWRTGELHLEIETYTWDVLPDAVRGTNELVEGLEREYRHVMGLLEGAGWSRE